MFDKTYGWKGYSDAKPSESIQKHELPGMAVSVVFPYAETEEILNIPVKQFKEYGRARKVEPTNRLNHWLKDQKSLGLEMAGFLHAHTQNNAALLGMKLIEELPDTRIENHYDSFRLYFGDNHINFAQGVALQYYLLTVGFGALKALSKLPKEYKNVAILMDRFPDCDTGNTLPGERPPKTQGAKFIEYIESESATWQGISEENSKNKSKVHYGTLDWWKPRGESAWRKGKTHPHFKLPDWFVSAAIAHEFREDYVKTFPNEEIGMETADALNDLFDTLKTFDIWSFDANVLEHLRANETKWEIPESARDYILERANSTVIPD